jgi:hypothetical protein
LQWDKLAIYTIPNCNYWYLTFFCLVSNEQGISTTLVQDNSYGQDQRREEMNVSF